METFLGIMIPFLGTTLGAACVFFMKRSLGDLVQRSLAGFAAGVMVAASIWSLLIPAIEQSEDMGKLSFLPAFIGFWIGVLFLLLLDRLIPHLHVGSEQAEGPKSKLGRTTMMVLAVTLHNIPEGMAVGVVYAGFLAGNTQITAASALVLSLGIAIQNFPEGAIISMPLRAEGEGKGRAFLGGVLSGIVEPIGAVLTLLAAQLVIPALPYLLSFAAGAMLYVVVEELIPEMSQGRHSNLGTVFFAVGFSVMMVLDCTVLQGSVANMIFAGDWFDAVTAFETVYFWPDLPQCFREVYRVLKPGGTFLICNESNGDTDKDKKWTEIIGGMTIYKDAELKTYLEQAGFHDVQIHKKKSWLCITAWK